MFQEYPKSLYMDGDVEKEHVIVRDADEEASKRAEGFMMFAEAYEAAQKGEETPVKRGPGRPRKEA